MTAQTRAMAAMLAASPRLTSRIIGPPPIVDGNTLDPSVHLLLWLADQIGAVRPEGLEARRESMRANCTLVMPPIAGVTTHDHLIAGRIPARTFRTSNAPAPLLMFLHGGGWVVGDLDTHDGTARMLALHSGCTVVSVDYALAPEHPFPAGLDDATAAFDALSQDPEKYGGVPGPVAVAGDSAGANLAAALCLVRRPSAAALYYPALDLRMTGASIETFADGYVLTKNDMVWYRAQYLPDLSQMVDPLVSPMLADDLRGFPPTAIWTAGFDPLRDDGAAFAARLRESGVPTSYTCHTAQIHGFLGMGVLRGGMPRIADVARQTGRLIRRFGRSA